MKIIDLLKLLYSLDCCNVRVVVYFINDCEYFDFFGFACSVLKNIKKYNLCDCIVCEFRKSNNCVYIECAK